MNIDGMSYRELLIAAAKAEVNSREVYEYLSENTKTFVVSDRFRFLADEEQKHEEFIRTLYQKIFDGSDMNLDEETPLPIPFIKYDEQSDESEIIEQAMEAEIAARDFYLKIAKKAEDERYEDEVVQTMKYLAGMEQNHYYILESELERIKEFETFDEYFPQMHMGP